MVIDEDPELCDLLSRRLAAARFGVDIVPSGEQAAHAVGQTRYAAVTLDTSLRGRDGLALLREMRRRHDWTPVLVLTAADGLEDRIAALQSGADDCLAKPVAPEEVVARLKALTRRPREMLGSLLHVGDVTFDADKREVRVKGAPHVLSGQELALLELLMRRPGQVASRKYLDDQLFGPMAEVGRNATEVVVHRLRKRLDGLPAGLQIRTVRGVGYLLEAKR